MGAVRIPASPLPGGGHRDGGLRPPQRRGRRALVRRRAAARHGLRALSGHGRSVRRPPPFGHEGARIPRRGSRDRARDRLPRGLHGRPARVADGEDALRRRRAQRLPARMRVRAPSGPRGPDAQVGQEEAQAALVRRRRQPRGRARGGRTARRRVRRARRVRDRLAERAGGRARRRDLEYPGLTGRGRYAALLRTPYVRPMLALSVLARLPLGINALAIVLLLRHEGYSFGAAGAAAGALAIGVGVSGPYISRLIDRHGQRPILAPLSVAHAGCLLLIIVVTLAHAPEIAIVGVSFVAGLPFPPIGSVMRPLWPRLLADRPELLTTAFALDAAIVEVSF